MSMSDSDAEHLGCLQSLWRSVMSANATSDASDLWRHLQAYLDYADLCYWQWLVWLFYPLVLTFLLPVVVFISLYCCALFLHLYRMRALLRASASESYHDFWHGARRFISIMFEAQGKIWHSYEVVGFEKIPTTGPALIIFYHGTLPIDLYYMVAKLVVQRNRIMGVVGDRFLFKIPGFKVMTDVFYVLPGSISNGVEQMKAGHLLAIAPGGVREAYFSDEYYKVLWGKRVGFAKIAIEAKVPVIPMFTQNCREAFRSLSIGRSWFRRLYEKTRLPLVPIYGYFPVKLRTFIGDPIPYDPEVSAEQLAEKVQGQVKRMIAEHQRVPGSIFWALLERFYPFSH